jgi:hypothetical protein
MSGYPTNQELAVCSGGKGIENSRKGLNESRRIYETGPS